MKPNDVTDEQLLTALRAASDWPVNTLDDCPPQSVEFMRLGLAAVLPDNTDDGHGRDVHTWFSLTYANYLVVPRTLLQSMPKDWQARFVVLLDELGDAFDHIPQADSYDVRAGTWQMAAECTDDELRLAGVKGPEEKYEIGEDGESALAEDQERTWLRLSDGATLTENDYVFIPGADPVPHYNRGRTHIEPHLTRGDS